MALRALPLLAFSLAALPLGGCTAKAPGGTGTDDSGGDGGADENDEIEDVGEAVIDDLDWSDVKDLDSDSERRRLATFVGYFSYTTSSGGYGRCTASLVSPTLAITNEHCVDDAANIRVNFGYLEESDYNSLSDLRDEAFACDDVVLSDASEDVALVRCAPDANDGAVVGDVLGGYIELPLTSSVSVEEDDELYILHQNCYYETGSCGWSPSDANGEATKKMSPGVVMQVPSGDYTFSSGASFDGDGAFVHSADTLGGTSGSLVFSATGNGVIGLHHGGSSSGNKARWISAVVENVSSFADTISDDIDAYGCSIDVTYPSGGETLAVGTSYTVAWDSDCESNVQVHLYKGGGYYYTLASNDPNDGELEFTPISSFPDGSDYQICISTTDDAVYGCSEEFTIGDSAECSIDVTYPDGAENLVVGTSYTVEWDSDCESNVQVHLYKGGGYYYTLASNDPNDGELEFTPISSFPDGSDYQICISTTDDAVYGCGGEFEISSDATADDGEVEFCVSIDSSSGYACADWVTDGAGVEDESCDLDYAQDGELWIYAEGWDSSPVASDSSSFTELCATVAAESGDILYVNGRFENTDSEVPILYGGEWWWCANWYGVGATAGTFTIDGLAVTPTLYDPGTGGYDCLVEVP
jgi:hypothetical protein